MKGPEIKPRAVYGYFDKVTLRTARPLTPKQFDLLNDNSHFVDERNGHPIRDSDDYLLLTIVGPNERALRFLADRYDWWVNYVEVAIDIILPTQAAKEALTDLFDRGFVQPWHGKRRDRLIGGTTRYTGEKKRGLIYVWYSDRPSKRTGAAHCFHIEARYQGLPAVRRLGIDLPRDLLTFNHEVFWETRMALFSIDFERLGQLHSNRISGQRQRKQKPTGIYIKDRRTGGTLYRVMAFDPEYAREKDQNVEPERALHRNQTFAGAYGRGDYMIKLDVSAFIPRKETLSLVD